MGKQLTVGKTMKDHDAIIQKVAQRLRQAKEEKRRFAARQQAKAQSELDRCNLLLGRALTESWDSQAVTKIRGYLGNCKGTLSALSEKDFNLLMAYCTDLIATKKQREGRSESPRTESA